MQRRRTPFTLAAVVLLTLFVGLTLVAAQSAPPERHTITLNTGPGLASAAPLVIQAGDTVTWTNADEQKHMVAAADGSFSSATLAPGEATSMIFDTPGTYRFICDLDSTMQSAVVVEPAQSSGPSVAINDSSAAAPFAPANLTIQAGQTVTWTSASGQPHNVTSTEQSFASSTLNNGQSYQRRFDTPGTYNYLCTIHPNMRGSITVQGQAQPSPTAQPSPQPTQRRIFLPLVTRGGSTTPAPTPTPPPGPAPSGPAWSNPATWPNNRVPQAGEAVTIPAGRTVLLDVSPPALQSLTIDGTLIFAERDLSLTANWIMVHGQGRLQIGSPTRPFRNRATITLTGNNPAENVMGMGTKFLGAMMGGKIEIYGEERVDWTRLNATAAKGATQLVLASPVDWRAGERIAVASTMIDPNEAEERSITAVSADGRSITLDRPLDYLHWGTVQSFDGGRVQADQRAEVGLLSRTIVIQGDEGSTASRFGGHMMIMGADATRIETNPALRSSARIRGVEFRRMGQFDRLGRYPFHWHLNGDSTGDFLEGSAISNSIQRGIVVHGTSNVRVKDNVVFNTPGHAISVETGAEMDNTFDGNLALLPRPVTLTQEVLRTQGDNKAAAYWIKGVNNVFTNNVAAGGQFGGFWFDDPEENGTSRLTFTGNVAHSHAATEGAGVWLQGRRLDFSRLNFSGLNLYKNAIGFWPDNDAPATVRDSSFADNEIAVTGDGNISNSAIVGRSANREEIGPVWAERWGGAGLRVYNNAASMQNVTFVNFTDDGSAVNTVACRNESVRIRSEGVRWVNARPTFCAGDTIVDDMDGSFSGTGRYTMVLSDPIMFTADLGCTTRADGATLCPERIDHQYMFIKRDLTAAAGEIQIRRDVDGLDQLSTFFPGFAVTIPGKSYTLNKGLATVPQMNFYLVKGRKDTIAANPASRVQLRVPVPDGNFRVWRSFVDGCYTCGWNPNAPELRRSQLSAATSLADMQAADGEKYFYDQANGMLYLLLGPTKPVFVERGS